MNKNVQNQKFRVVDLEVKSDQVQYALTQILFNILEINGSLSITTPSFCVNFLKQFFKGKGKNEKVNKSYIRFIFYCLLFTLILLAGIRIIIFIWPYLIEFIKNIFYK